MAEADAWELMRRESLQPRTATILADYASIAYRYVEVDPNGGEEDEEPPAATSQPAVSGGTAALPSAPPAPPQHYTVRTEPFVPTGPDQLATLGVGRIPLESLGDASAFFVRGLVRERLSAHWQPRLLMVANSGLAHRSLPLCEAISRVTAGEFKNFGIHVDEFYGRLTDSPEILMAARSATVILYEGHVSYQDLIDEPVLRRSQAEEYPLDEEGLGGSGGAKRAADRDAGHAPAPRVVPAESTSRHMQGPLAGLPIVVLQSCESLDDAVLWRLDELGGAALIGSMTPIHSGCGGSLLNAAMTSLLYRGGTLGESLRDAENYMFCVEELKARRGHKEGAKGVRVALEFPPLGRSRAAGPAAAVGRAATSARAGRVDRRQHGADPNARVAASRSSSATNMWPSMFPNSQVAGLLKSEGEAVKRISPFYYFCLPLRSTNGRVRGGRRRDGTGAVARRCQAGRSAHRSAPRRAVLGLFSRPGDAGRVGRLAPPGRARGRADPEGREVTGKSNSAWAVVVLLVLGIGFLVVRINLHLEAGDSDYRLTYRAAFAVPKPAGAIAPEVRLLAAFPETTRYCRVLEEEVDAPAGMEQVRTRVHAAASRKDIVLLAEQDGPVHLFDLLSGRIQPPRRLAAEHGRSRRLPPQERTTYLGKAKDMTATSATAQEMVDRLRDNHPGPQELVDRIFQKCRDSIEPAGDLGTDSGDEALLRQSGSPLGRARAFATLCRAAKLPARLVTGFEIKRRARPARWGRFGRARGSKSTSPIRRNRPSDTGCRTIRRTAPCMSWTTTSSPCGATAWI